MLEGPRKLWQRLVRVGLTLGIVALAFLAIVLGSQYLASRSAMVPAADPAPLMPVATRPFILSSHYTVTRSFTGQLEPRRNAAVSFELAGQLASIVVEEGDRISMGQVIATLDTRLLEAERERLRASREALEAQLVFADQTVTRQSQLREQGFTSTAALDGALARVDELKARIAEVRAGLEINTIRIEKSVARAPFDGRIAARHVDGGESIVPGQGLVEIVDEAEPLVRVGFPLNVDVIEMAELKVEIAGEIFAAEVQAVRPDVDPATRTRTALLSVATSADPVFGQTVRILLTEQHAQPGIWVPLTSLREGLRGQWTLLAVDAGNTVRSLSVQIVHVANDQVYVRGAFPGDMRLIAGGPQRITVGQTVAPQPAS